MKLFLSSLSIPSKNEYIKLFDNTLTPKVAVITNAWGTYDTERSQPYINAILALLQDMNIVAERIDLLDYVDSKEALDSLLNDFDGIWMTGGNSYYLNWCIHQSGFDKIIRKHCERGLVYGGESAGAIIAGPTLDHFQSMDNPDDAPQMILDGLRLTDIVIIPHADNLKYGEVLTDIKASLDRDGFETLVLTDGEAVIINGGNIKRAKGVES